MAESPADRCERIAEALFVMMVGRTTHDQQPLLAGLCAEQARKLADTFVAGAPEQPQPSADASPSLLEAAKEVIHAAYCAEDAIVGVNSQLSKAYHRLIDAIKREEARRG